MSLFRKVVLAVAMLIGGGWSWPAFCEGPRVVKTLVEMRRDRMFVQEWDLSCGAAALATILRYHHGDPITEKDVAKGLIARAEYVENPRLVRVRHGFSLLDLKRFVQRRGYKGIGYGGMALDDLLEHAPVLVPVAFNGYNHFVVFRGMRGNRVLLADPAWGNRTMPAAKFETAWLEYPELGKVGFTVVKEGRENSVNGLAPRDDDFVFLR